MEESRELALCCFIDLNIKAIVGCFDLVGDLDFDLDPALLPFIFHRERESVNMESGEDEYGPYAAIWASPRAAHAVGKVKNKS